MGAYLSEPQTEKISFDESHDHIEWGVSGMQGWRMSMEDAHCCHADLDKKKTSMFGVFDGHGGKEVAEYCAQNFHRFLLDGDDYGEGNIKKALRTAFLTIDEAIMSEEVLAELKAMAGSVDDDDEDEAALLLEEANMPIGELLERFKGNVKEKLKESGVLFDDGEKGDGSKENENEEKQKVNGHAEVTDEEKPSTTKSRKQKNPVKRILEDIPNTSSSVGDTCDASNGIDSGRSSSSCSGGTSGEAAASSTSSSACDSAGSSSVSLKSKENTAGSSSSASGGSSSSGNLSSDQTTNGQSTKEKQSSGKTINDISAVDDEDEENSEEEEDDDEGDEDDDDEFEDGEDMEFQQGSEEVGKDSGTTAVISLIYNNTLYVANAGDSRCVLCRNGAPIEMSIDHKPEDEIERNRIERAGGKITMDGRINGGLNLSRAIGDHSYKQNKDLPPDEQIITPAPDVKEIELTKDDTFMVLACDGIWNVMTNEEVIDFVKTRLQKEEKLSKICEELFDYCLAPNTENDGTGCDNMTCIIVRFKNESERDSSSKKAVKRTSNTSEETKSKKARLTSMDI